MAPPGVIMVLNPVGASQLSSVGTSQPSSVPRPVPVQTSALLGCGDVEPKMPMPQSCSPPVISGLNIRVIGWDCPGTKGDLYVYRPPQIADLSKVIVYGEEGEELFQLPPHWMVLRAADCPLLWVQLRWGVALPPGGASCVMLIEWDAPSLREGEDPPIFDAVHGTLVGEAMRLTPVPLDEGLLRTDPAKPQIRMLLEPHCDQTLRLWLRHAQQLGSAT